MKGIVTHAGEEIGIEFTPSYNPSMSIPNRVGQLFTDARNKQEEVNKEKPVFKNNTVLFVRKMPNKAPIMVSPKEVLGSQDEAKGAIPIILGNQRAIAAPLSNPSPAASELIISAGADTREDMMATLGRLIPETTQLELANMISADGKRAAIDLTMAKMSSGNEPAKSLKSPVSDVLMSPDGPVSREKLAYQALGVRAGRQANIDAKYKRDLRTKISNIVGLAGKGVPNKWKIGQLPFIDNHTFITKTHIDNFRSMLTLYHYIRANNKPYMEAIVSGIKGAEDKKLLPVEKMLDYLMPTPDHLFRGLPVMFFTQSMGKLDTYKESKFRRLIFGILEPSVRAELQQERMSNIRSANALVQLYNGKRNVLAKDINIAVSELASRSGDKGFEWNSEMPDKKTTYADAGGLPENTMEDIVMERFDNRGNLKQAILVEIPSYLIHGVAIHPSSQRLVVDFLEETSNAKDATKDQIKRVKKIQNNLKKFPHGLVTVNQNGFDLPPIGWSRAWMIPVMMVIDEYWDMLQAQDAPIELHELLYLIGIKAVEVSGYEIQPQEYLLILLLLGVYERESRTKSSKVELTLNMLDPRKEEGILKKHLDALKALNKAVDLKDLSVDEEKLAKIAKEIETDNKKLEKKLERYIDKKAEADEKAALSTPSKPDMDLDKALEMMGEDAKRLGLARRRSLNRRALKRLIPFDEQRGQGTLSILPFGSRGRLSPGTKYFDQSPIVLTEKEKETIDETGKEWMELFKEQVNELEDDFEIVMESWKAAGSLFTALARAEKSEDAKTLALATKLLTSVLASTKAIGVVSGKAMIFKARQLEAEKVSEGLMNSLEKAIEIPTKEFTRMLKAIEKASPKLDRQQPLLLILDAILVTLMQLQRVASKNKIPQEGTLIKDMNDLVEEVKGIKEVTEEKVEEKAEEEKKEVEEKELTGVYFGVDDINEVDSALDDWLKRLPEEGDGFKKKIGKGPNAGKVWWSVNKDNYDPRSDNYPNVKELMKSDDLDENKLETIVMAVFGKGGQLETLTKSNDIRNKNKKVGRDTKKFKATFKALEKNLEELKPVTAIIEEGDTTLDADLEVPVDETESIDVIGDLTDAGEIIIETKDNPPFSEYYDIQGKKQTRWFTPKEWAKMKGEAGLTATKSGLKPKKKRKGGKNQQKPKTRKGKLQAQKRRLKKLQNGLKKAEKYHAKLSAYMPKGMSQDTRRKKIKDNRLKMNKIEKEIDIVNNRISELGGTKIALSHRCGTETRKKISTKTSTGQDEEAAKRTEENEAELLAEIRARNKKARNKKNPWDGRKQEYKGVEIVKIDGGYSVPELKQNFSKLKTAKSYIDSLKDGRRKDMLLGHTCVYTVNNRKCGGPLFTTKSNPPIHKCDSCGAKYRLEGV